MSFNLRSREPRCQKETQQEFNGRAPARFLLPYLPDAGQSALSLWPDMRPLRFRRVPFGRDGAFDRGGATASRMAMPHMLPSTGSERLGLRNVTSFVAQSPTPSDHCVRFASAVADD